MSQLIFCLDVSGCFVASFFFICFDDILDVCQPVHAGEVESLSDKMRHEVHFELQH